MSQQRLDGRVVPSGAVRIPRWVTPGDHPATPIEASVTVPAGLTATLGVCAGTCATTEDAIFLAAHLSVLRVLTGQTWITTEVVGPGGHRAVAVEVTDATWRELVIDAAAALSNAGPATVPEQPEAVLLLPGFDVGTDPGIGPLSVEVRGQGDTSVLTARSRTDVMSGEHLTRIAGYYRSALESLAAGLADDHRARTLLPDAEIDHQRRELAGEYREFGDSGLGVLLARQARRTPDAVAASHRDRSWTFEQLDRRVNQIANALLSRGLLAEDVVAVVLDRDLEWLAVLLGVLRAGGVYLPVSPGLPAARIADHLETAKSRFVVAAEPVTGDAGRTTLHPADLSGATDDPAVAVRPDQLAYIYFTSGSTGRPKGVMCEHAGMINHLLVKAATMRLRAGDVMGQTAPQSFDISLWQAVAPLLVGASTRIIDTDVLLDVDRFADEISGAEVDVIQLVPSYLETFVGVLEGRRRGLGGLRTVSVTGEILRHPLVRRWFALYPDIPLINAYGATELSDDTMHEVLDRVPARDPVPIGRSLPNVRAYVLDDRQRIVPLGSPGEIAFAGVCVGRGYVGASEATRAAFTTDPYRPGARMYRTGDYGRWLPEGSMEFLGRRDRQVKIRGFRVELGEIEKILLSLPGVRDAAVVADDRGPGGARILVAFLAGRLAPDGSATAARLAALLPDYMVPTYYHRLDRLPLTAGGKVDHSALSQLAATLGHADGSYVAPTTTAEQRVAMAWAEVLNTPIERIGCTDDFFQLGGNSLTAVWTVVKLDGQVSLQQVVRHPKLADLARVLDRTVRGRPRSGVDLRSGLLQQLGTGPDGTVVCFPDAGGNAINFQPLATALAARGVGVHGVELPGHDFGTSLAELAPVPEIAERVAAELAGLPRSPLTIWGQGTGAAPALALARLLGADPRLSRVLIGGHLLQPVEELNRETAAVQSLSDRAVAEHMLTSQAYVAFDGLAPERMAVIGAAYRHDVVAANTCFLAAHQDPDRYRITVPIGVVVAADDPATASAPHRYRDWGLLSPDVSLHRLGGGHHFTRTQAADIAGLIAPGRAEPGYRMASTEGL